MNFADRNIRQSCMWSVAFLRNGKTSSRCLLRLSRLLLEQSGVSTMGRGRGGYTQHQLSYRDSGGHKVHDPGTIFVAERYMDMGYESVFRREINGVKRFDLTIKTSDDVNFVKNIEVKRCTTDSASQIAKNIKRAGMQIGNGDTIALVLPNYKLSAKGIGLAQSAFNEAKRKGWVKGPIEVWFNDKQKFNLS